MSITELSPSPEAVWEALKKLPGWMSFTNVESQLALRLFPRIGTIPNALSVVLHDDEIIALSGSVRPTDDDFKDYKGDFSVAAGAGLYRVTFDSAKDSLEPVAVEWIPWSKVTHYELRTSANVWRDSNDQPGMITLSLKVASGDHVDFTAPHHSSTEEFRALTEFVDFVTEKVAS